jgi:hypothetical protein
MVRLSRLNTLDPQGLLTRQDRFWFPYLYTCQSRGQVETRLGTFLHQHIGRLQDWVETHLGTFPFPCTNPLQGQVATHPDTFLCLYILDSQE